MLHELKRQIIFGSLHAFMTIKCYLEGKFKIQNCTALEFFVVKLQLGGKFFINQQRTILTLIFTKTWTQKWIILLYTGRYGNHINQHLQITLQKDVLSINQ